MFLSSVPRQFCLEVVNVTIETDVSAAVFLLLTVPCGVRVMDQDNMK